MKRIFIILYIISNSFIGLTQEKRTYATMELTPTLVGIKGTKSTIGEQDKSFGCGVSFYATYKMKNTIGLSFGAGYEYAGFNYDDKSMVVHSDYNIDPETGEMYEKTYLSKKIRSHNLLMHSRLSVFLGSKKLNQLFLGFGLTIPVVQDRDGKLHSKSDPHLNDQYAAYPQKETSAFKAVNFGYNRIIKLKKEEIYFGFKVEQVAVDIDYLNSFFDKFKHENIPSYCVNVGLVLGIKI